MCASGAHLSVSCTGREPGHDPASIRPCLGLERSALTWTRALGTHRRM